MLNELQAYELLKDIQECLSTVHASRCAWKSVSGKEKDIFTVKSVYTDLKMVESITGEDSTSTPVKEFDIIPFLLWDVEEYARVIASVVDEVQQSLLKDGKTKAENEILASNILYVKVGLKEIEERLLDAEDECERI